MIRNLTLVLAIALMAAAGSAQTSGAVPAPSVENPVAQVRAQRSWEYGPFVNWGTGLDTRDNFKFFFTGFELGKVISPVVHAGILSGQFQLAGNIIPLWQAYTPPPHLETFTYTGTPFQAPVGGGTYTGVSVTPAIFRWNFLTPSKRFQPWFQAAGAVIYTTHKFPPDALVPHGTPGGTSVFNFSSGAGVGVHYFTRPGQSLDLCVSAAHISSASLGDRNPGVNASIQVQMGYTFWR
ncbi:MAG: acyloxyacyl hydrolase [Terracidiphilus sp.]